MKKIQLILIGLISLNINAHEWAPLGTEWYYDVTYMKPKIDYSIITCDSIVKYKGVDCHRIKLNNCACNTHFCGDLYTFERNDTVFFFNTDIDTFQILYNFNAIRGDRWEIYTKVSDDIIDTIQICVDSVTTININGQILKKQYVTYKYNFRVFYGNGNVLIHSYNRKSEIIDNIGDIGYLINIEDKRTGTCDFYITKGLRCYNDINIGHYSTGTRDSCTYVWDLTPLNKLIYKIDIYPNPTYDKVRIILNGSKTFSYAIYSTSGQILKIGKNLEIDIHDFREGIYYLKMIVDNKTIMTRKIVKSTCPNTVYKP